MDERERVNILLVDDQPAKLLSYEVILAGLGENLIKANSAREALEFLLKNDVAVLLVDVCMPELDGFELARLVREHPRFEKTTIIFISAIQLSDVDRMRGYDTGAVDYVPVPVVPEILRAKVRVFVDLWRKTRQLEQINQQLDLRVRQRTSELEDSNNRLLETAERLRLASEAAGFGIYDYTPATRQMYCSPYLLRLFGLKEADDVTLDHLLECVDPEHRELLRRHFEGHATERWEIEFQVFANEDGARWLLDRGQVMTLRPNSQPRVMGTILDVTERKKALERQVLLTAELDHRVKNILANVSALVRLSSRGASSISMFVESLDGRLQAVARAHSLLQRGGWTGVSLSELASDALSPFRLHNNVGVAGPALAVAPKFAQSLALIFHELATNAVKHGALSVPTGHLELTWDRPTPETLRLSWRETGGPPAKTPDRRGFGLTLLQSAVEDLSGQSSNQFGPSGFEYTLEVSAELLRPMEATQNDRTQGDLRQPGAMTVDIARGRKILLVEDEVLVALQLQSDLEEEGHSVIGPASSLKQGMLLAANQDFDVAILDVSLGSETSAQIAETLRGRSVPFAFATGYSDLNMLPSHLRRMPRLSKPYAVSEIRAMLKELLLPSIATARTATPELTNGPTAT